MKPARRTRRPRRRLLVLLTAGTALAVATVVLALASWRSAAPAELPALHGARVAFVLEDWVEVPASRGEAPLARINGLIAAPGDPKRLFVNDMSGRIHVIEDGRVRAAPLLDMVAARPRAFTSQDLFEQGLASFAFHPDFATPGKPGFGRLYTFATELAGAAVPTFGSAGTAAHHDVVAEWRVDAGGSLQVEPGSYRELMRIAHPLHDHVGGQLGFDPHASADGAEHGLLYIGVGDGGNTLLKGTEIEQGRYAQDKRVPLGKILRIDPIGRDGARYAIPPSNPFAREADALPEIWAYGLRNPARFSWDMGGSGKMLIADIGQLQLEEIDVGERGANYGWSEREAFRPVDRRSETARSELPLQDGLRGFTYPALAYGRHVGTAVTGGFVYRGERIPELRGMYVFGDTVSGRVLAAPVDQLRSGVQAAFYELPLQHGGRAATLRQIVGAARADLRFGVDASGELYLLSKQDGRIRRLVRSVVAESGVWPVEAPLDVLGDTPWTTRLRGRMEATLRTLGRQDDAPPAR